MADAIQITGKDVILAETSYPWKALPDKVGLASLQWPQTPRGRSSISTISSTRFTPRRQSWKGFIYWYPEAIPHSRIEIWRQGYEALFDPDGNALPALDAFSRHG